MKEFNTPILFIIFNSPDTAGTVFNEIKKVKPKQLFIFSDGARENREDEAQKCLETRKIVNKVDWECDLKTLFLDKNHGPRKAVSSAINWFFKNVENGIILEHDCLPDPSFFWYCQELLEYYHDDKRIMHISGTNYLNGKKIGDGSYYFSKIAHIWGFATWRRAWKYYDIDIKNFPKFKEQNQIENIFEGKFVQKHWLKIFKKMQAKSAQTWDHQWNYAIFSQNGLAINPNVNLITNIGFGENAVHCIDTNSKFANMKRYDIDEIIHPSFTLPNKEADKYILANNFQIGLLAKIKRELRRIYKR